MRAWTTSACLVFAWSILAFFVVAVGLSRPVHLTQANTSTLSSSSSSSEVSVAAPAAARPQVRYVVRAGDSLSAIAAEFGVRGGWPALYAANRRAIGPDPDVIRAGTVLVVPGRLIPVRYTVATGDSLSAIAARFGVRGGWPALYAANRRAIGSNPDVIQAGIVLAIPHPPVEAAPTAGSTHHRAVSSHHRAVSSPPARPSPARHPVPPTTWHAPVTTGMPGWLRTTLLAAGLLIAVAFLTEPVLAVRRRRRRTARAGRIRVVLADHDRLVVTRSQSDDMVYVLRPPGADPKAILRVASLVLPESRYGELAEQLGVPATWPME
jgi:LysM repeat protein